SVGGISAENITPYPPGIPVVTPGERIRSDVVDYLRSGLERGMHISGVADPTLATLRLVRERRDRR
ncbi:MAG: ornithine decarboxylase, partial [Chloroflexota bacterium]